MPDLPFGIQTLVKVAAGELSGNVPKVARDIALCVAAARELGLRANRRLDDDTALGWLEKTASALSRTAAIVAAAAIGANLAFTAPARGAAYAVGESFSAATTSVKPQTAVALRSTNTLPGGKMYVVPGQENNLG